jgi:hypothetical protein
MATGCENGSVQRPGVLEIPKAQPWRAITCTTIRRAVFMGALASTLILTACSALPGGTAMGAKASPTATAIPVVPLAQDNPTISADSDGLHIDGNFTCPRYEVLATSRLSYDATEIRQIETYYSTTQSYPFPAHPLGLPDSMSIVEGSGGSQYYGDCAANIELANTSSQTIQVERVGVSLLARPQPNTYTYRLIDICSLTGIDEFYRSPYCPAAHGGQTVCSGFTTDVELTAGTSGAVYDGVPKPVYKQDDHGRPCSPQMTLNPTDADEVKIHFDAGAFRFSVALHLTLLTADGEKTVTVSQFPSALTFSAPNQFSCYKLTGTTFSLEYQGAQALEIPQEPPNWDCVRLTD